MYVDFLHSVTSHHVLPSFKLLTVEVHTNPDLPSSSANANACLIFGIPG